MTQTEALSILRKEVECRSRSDENNCVGFLCYKCEYKVPYSDLIAAIKVAVEALELCVMIEDDKR